MHRKHRAQGPALLAHASWSTLPPSPLGVRSGPTLAWDGRELLEIGGSQTTPFGELDHGDGAAYSPATNSWRMLPTAPDGATFSDSASAWTGHLLFLYRGLPRSGSGPCCDAAFFDPARNQWSPANVPVDQLADPAAVWTGGRILLTGVAQHPSRREVAAFDPKAGRWRRLDPPIRKSHPPEADGAIVTSRDGVLLWSFWSRITRGPGFVHGVSGMDVFRLGRSGRWRNETGRWRSHKLVTDAVRAGSTVLIPPTVPPCLGGCRRPSAHNLHGYVLDPRTLRLTAIRHGPVDDALPTVIWTGAVAVSFVEASSIVEPHQAPLGPGDIAIWNPQSRHWRRGRPAARLPQGSYYDAPVWGGGRLYALGTDGELSAYGSQRR